MNMPGFDAESSLGRTMSAYRGKAVFGGTGAGGVLPMQGTLSSSIFSQNLNLGFRGSVWPVIRCCKYSRFAGAVVCAQRVHSPLERCECIFPECPAGFPDCSDFPDLPFIVCRPPVATL
jgi:hypothetical protein